ncbi:MAG TPA: lipase family protein [Candidatus Elarobacter sp.]|jgi:hypothetical protein
MPVTSAQKRAAVDLAALAYTDEVHPANRIADMKAGLAKIPAAANGPWKLVWGPGEVEGILAYVALAADKTTYGLAFRGSLGEIMAHEFIDNVLLNGETFRQVPWLHPQGGEVKVSAGMNQALAYVTMLTDQTTHKHLLDFLREVTAANDDSLNLLVTGHSLGGAIVQLASQWLYHQLVEVDGNEEIYIAPLTFAAPTTGNQQFATLFETTFPTNYALVNTLDIVPMAWWNLGGIQHMYPPPAQNIAQFGVAVWGLLTIYKDSLAKVYRPVMKPAPDTFRGWMPEHPDKFAHTMGENHTISIYRGHVAWATGIPL